MGDRQKTIMKGNATRFGPHFQFALVCLLCLGVGFSLHHPNRVVQRTSAGLMQPRPAGPQFVIADLDGDRKPDVASVETASARSANTNYSIRLQFGAGAVSAIGVSAPIGGLQVAARDVNGVDSIDLILTSNLDASFVEVLLNDGHGNFSVADPGAYREVENESNVFLNAPARPVIDQTTLASLRSSFGEEGAPLCDCHAVLPVDSLALAKDQTARQRFAHTRLGRSPPAIV
jgi:hypothetical protein